MGREASTFNAVAQEQLKLVVEWNRAAFVYDLSRYNVQQARVKRFFGGHCFTFRSESYSVRAKTPFVNGFVSRWSIKKRWLIV